MSLFLYGKNVALSCELGYLQCPPRFLAQKFQNYVSYLEITAMWFADQIHYGVC